MTMRAARTIASIAAPVAALWLAASAVAACAVAAGSVAAADSAPPGEASVTTALLAAVHADDLARVQQLIEAGADVNARNEFGATPMSEAALNGSPAMIGALLKAGAAHQALNADGMNALMVVARGGNVEAAKLLLRAGADVNAVEKVRGQTALMWAASNSRPDMVKLLVKSGAKVDARSNFDLDTRQVSGEPRAQARPIGGMTALMFAARQGCLDCARHLVDADASTRVVDPEGVSVLLLAIINAHWDTAKLLIENGADVNRWDWWGRSPVYGAVDLVTVPQGGRPDRPSLDKTTGYEILAMLLARGANPNIQLKLLPPYRALGPDRGADTMLTIGASPLLRAAKAGDARSVKLLLEHGANPNLPNQAGIAPIGAAAGHGSTDIDTRGMQKTQAQAVDSIDLLVKAGGDVDAKDIRGRTAIYGAAIWVWNDVVKALVERGASLITKDNTGMTPLDAALGRAGGNGRGGTRIDVQPATAALIRELMTAKGLPLPQDPAVTQTSTTTAR